MSVIGGRPADICSMRVLRILTRSGQTDRLSVHFARPFRAYALARLEDAQSRDASRAFVARFLAEPMLGWPRRRVSENPETIPALLWRVARGAPFASQRPAHEGGNRASRRAPSAVASERVDLLHSRAARQCPSFRAAPPAGLRYSGRCRAEPPAVLVNIGFTIPPIEIGENAHIERHQVFTRERLRNSRRANLQEPSRKRKRRTTHPPQVISARRSG